MKTKLINNVTMFGIIILSIISIPLEAQNTSNKKFEVNNISMYVLNNGILAANPQKGEAGIEWPKGSGKRVLYASGIWIGATVSNEVRVSGIGYLPDRFESEFSPGPVNANGEKIY